MICLLGVWSQSCVTECLSISKRIKEQYYYEGIEAIQKAADSLADLSFSCDSCALYVFESYEWIVFRAKQDNEFRIQGQAVDKLPELLSHVTTLDSLTKVNLQLDAHLRKAHYFFGIGALDQASESYQDIIDEIGFGLVPDDEMYITYSVCLQKLGVIQFAKYNYHKAISLFNYAINHELNRAEKLNKKHGVYSMYALVANCYSELGDTLNAEQYYETFTAELEAVYQRNDTATLKAYAHIFNPLLLGHARFAVAHKQFKTCRKLFGLVGVTQDETNLSNIDHLTSKMAFYRSQSKMDTFYMLHNQANRLIHSLSPTAKMRIDVQLEFIQALAQQDSLAEALRLCEIIREELALANLQDQSWSNQYADALKLYHDLLQVKNESTELLSFYENLSEEIRERLSTDVITEDHHHIVFAFSDIIGKGLKFVHQHLPEQHDLYFQLMESTKALLLHKEVRGEAIDNRLNDSVLVEYQLLKSELTQSLLQQAKGDSSSDLKNKIFETDHTLQQLKIGLYQRANYDPTKSLLSLRVNFTQYVEELSSDHATLLFFADQHFYHGLYITKSLTKTILVNRQDIDPLIQDFYHQIPPHENGRKKTVPILHQLYNLLELKSIKHNRVKIAPDAQLNLLPFECLIDQHSNPWIESKYISYIPSIGFEVNYSDSYTHKFGNPSVGVYYPRFIERHDLYLKFGASESEYIQTLTGGDLFSSDSLSKYKFQATSSNYQIIHLVTHAKYNSEAQKLSYVQFNETAQAESQYLYLDEIKSLDLKCDLVCLSACETGKGATYQSEGLKSLARNFIIAGSQSVVSSLWNVSDQTTSEIMQSFYKYLYDKKDKSEALALAKRDYLNNHREDELHPYYWAGMVLVGHDAAIFKSEDTNILFYLFIFFAIAFILFLLLKRKLFY